MASCLGCTGKEVSYYTGLSEPQVKRAMLVIRNEWREKWTKTGEQAEQRAN